jgi:hypothetical protein
MRGGRKTPAADRREGRNMPIAEQILTRSYTRGLERPLLELTIGDPLQRTANRYPDRLAVASRHQEKRLT